MHTIAAHKNHCQVAVLISPELWKENHSDATEYALEEALNYFEGQGFLLPETFKVGEYEPGEWDNTALELNLPNNHDALMIFNGKVIG